MCASMTFITPPGGARNTEVAKPTYCGTARSNFDATRHSRIFTLIQDDAFGSIIWATLFIGGPNYAESSQPKFAFRIYS